MAEYIPFGNDWKRNVMRMRKADIVELFKSARIEVEKLTSTNKSSFQFPKLEDVTTEVHGRLNKKHLPWCGSAVVAIQETYSILAGNKKR